MSIEIKDITYYEQDEPKLGKRRGDLRLSLEDMKRLHELGVTISDTETTGLRPGENGLTEFASIRVRKDGKGKQPYKLELLHSFVLPLRPEYQDYLLPMRGGVRDY